MSSGLFRMMRLRAAIARALAAACTSRASPPRLNSSLTKLSKSRWDSLRLTTDRVDTPMMIATRIEKAIVSLRVRERWWKFIGKSGLREGRALCSVHAVLQGGPWWRTWAAQVITSDCAPPVRYLHSPGASLCKSLKH